MDDYYYNRVENNSYYYFDIYTNECTAEPSSKTFYDISFDSNGGTDVGKAMVESGKKVTKPADPRKTDYEFAGWYTDTSLTHAYNFDNTVTGGFTLYAKWTYSPRPVLNLIEITTDLATNKPAIGKAVPDPSINISTSGIYLNGGSCYWAKDTTIGEIVEPKVPNYSMYTDSQFTDGYYSYHLSMYVNTSESKLANNYKITIDGVEYAFERDSEYESREAAADYFYLDIFTKRYALHTTYHVDEIAPTCASYGVKAHYACSTCTRRFTDANAETVIADLAVWKNDAGRIEKLPHKYSSGWSLDEKEHWHACTVCGHKSNIATHNSKTSTTKATVNANGKRITTCNICNQITKTEIIYAAKNIALTKDEYTYNGKLQKPSVSVKDSKGNVISSNNYTVTYPSNSKAIGKYVVKVVLKGDYSGSKSLSFAINPKGTKLSKLTATSKGFTASWKVQAANTSGYQIQYSTSSNFKKSKIVTVSGNRSKSRKITKLAASKVYYVRVRTYKKIGSKNFCSVWSKAKKIKTLK